jgi:hypothetical protein
VFATLQQWISSSGIGLFDWLSCISYGLLALSYVMRDIKWLRIITMFACALDLIIYYQIRPAQPMWVQLFFTLVFMAINAYQLQVIWRDARRVSFDGDEAYLYKNVFQIFSPGEFRRILKYAKFEDLEQGKHLMRKDEHVDSICVLCRGALAIHLSGNLLNNIEVGSFVGEMGYLTQRPASVNVIATTASRVFRVDRKNLEDLELKHPDIHAKLTWIMGRDIAEKLRKLNVVTEGKDQALSGFGPSTFGPDIFSGRSIN